jgi:hypothetical protein
MPDERQERNSLSAIKINVDVRLLLPPLGCFHSRGARKLAYECGLLSSEVVPVAVADIGGAVASPACASFATIITVIIISRKIMTFIQLHVLFRRDYAVARTIV